MRFRRRLVLPLAAACLAMAAGGCGAPPLTEQARKNIEQDIRVRVDRRIPGNDPQVRAVECPEDVDRKKGENFTCKLTLRDGRARDVSVTQTDDAGGVRWRLAGR